MTFKATAPIGSMFVMLQHNATDFSKEAQSARWLYRAGWKDMATVFFYTIGAIIVHAVIQQYIVDKLQRKVHLSKTKTVKFNESGQMILFSVVSVLYAGYIINNHGYLSQVSNMWNGYPETHRILPFETKVFFILQIAYWMHTFPEFYFQKSKKDEIRIKSTVAVLYLLFLAGAYVLNFTRVAIFILFLHYAAESVFHFCRLAYFLERKSIAIPGFRIWNVIFVLTRLGCASLAVLTFWYGLRSFETPRVDLATGNFNTKFIRLNCLLTVCSLQTWMMWNFINFHLRRARERAAATRSRHQLKMAKKKTKKAEQEISSLPEVDQDSGRQLSRKFVEQLFHHLSTAISGYDDAVCTFSGKKLHHYARMEARAEANFNLSFLRRFWLLVKIMFPNMLSCTVLLATLVLLLGGLDQVATYYVGVMPSEFYQVLGGRDHDGFRTTLAKSFGLVVAKAILLTSITYATSILYINWRQLITQRLHSLYFNKHAFYDLNNLFSLKKIDNPDQRITQDVERTCRVFSEIFSKILMSPFIIAYYTYKAWDTSGYLGPVSIYIYFIVSTIINKFAMSPVIRCVAEQEKKEGDFRFKHMAVRTHAEAIAFYHSDSLEELFTEQRLESLLNTQQRLVNWRFLLNGVTNFVDYFGSILSYIIISIPILIEGKYDNVGPADISAIISRNSFYYLYLINSFSTLIDLNSKVSDMAGTAHRVAELYEELMRMSSNEKYNQRWSDHVAYVNNLLSRKTHDEDSKEDNANVADQLYSVYKNYAGMPLVSLHSIALYLPESNVCLVRDLTIDIVQGKHLLITGNSSCGKSSFLRMLCGFWKAQEGKLTRHVPNRLPWMLFLPQKPYFPSGTLRQQLVYPYRCSYCPQTIVDDEKLINLLRSVKLEHLVERCGGLDANVYWEWNDVLTPGESQRLSVLRAIYHRPLLTFLDEATSAMGTDYEMDIYKMLLSNGTTVVSVGHRHSIRQFHCVELHLTGDGSYSVGEISDSKVKL
uniref:ABC transporter domain-containing protein n=1 Tax=Trichuris muris TaxID=70415 RepID=A0A5S6R5V2_TRIMR